MVYRCGGVISIAKAVSRYESQLLLMLILLLTNESCRAAFKLIMPASIQRMMRYRVTFLLRLLACLHLISNCGICNLLRYSTSLSLSLLGCRAFRSHYHQDYAIHQTRPSIEHQPRKYQSFKRNMAHHSHTMTCDTPRHR